MKTITRLLFLCVLSGSFAAALAGPPQYKVIDLGTLGGNGSYGMGVNNSGQVTGWSYEAGGAVIHAFLYSSGTMTDLGVLNSGTGSNSFGKAINDSGVVTGRSEYTGTSGDIHAFLYSNSTMNDMGTLGGADSYGSGINSNGQVTGEADTSTPDQGDAFLYSSGNMQDLGTQGGASSVGYGVNDSGQVTGEAQANDTNRASYAFVVFNGTATNLGTLGGSFSAGESINNSGQVAGWAYTSGGLPHAFLYSSGTMTDLGTLGGAASYGISINNSGEVMGYATDTNNDIHVFLYSGGTMYDLNNLVAPSDMAGFSYLGDEVSAFFYSEGGGGINDNGWITGAGPKNGALHAFLAIPKPVATSPVAADGDLLLSRTALSAAGPPAIDAAGDVAFHVVVKSVNGGTGITSANNSGILLYNNASTTIVVTTGTANNSTGDVFTKVSDPVMSPSGALAFIGTLKVGSQVEGEPVTAANDSSVWVFQSGSANLVARTGGAAPGGGTFGGFTSIGINEAGGIAILATLKGTSGTPALFATDAVGTLYLITFKGDSFNVSGNPVTATSLTAFSALPLVGGQSRTLDVINGNVAALLKGAGGKTGIKLAVTGTTGFAFSAHIKTGDMAPNLPGVTIKTVGEPAVNTAGEIACSCVLTGTDVTSANDVGIILATATTGGLLARTGSSAPDTSGSATAAVFSKLSDPVLNNNGEIAFVGTLKTGGASGITGANDIGIWSNADGTMKRIAQKNDVAPGSTGKFSAFKQIVLPDVGGPIFLATLSAVPAVQNEGVWALTASHGLVPVVTKGQSISVGATTKTVKAIDIFQLPAGVLGQSRSFDASTAGLVYQVTFTDNTWGIYTAGFQ